MKLITHLKHNLARTALTLLLAVLTTTAWALEQDPDGYYLIGSVQDWQDFAALIQTNPTANARMTADIDLGDDQTVIADYDHPYQGTFDGQGYALTVNYIRDVPSYTAEFQHIAPFIAIQDATIQNLHVMGTITTVGMRPASITSYVKGTSYINNCWSEVAITSSYYSDIDAGGFVARVNGTNYGGGELHLDDCAFTGSISYNNRGYSVGGFVGWTQSGGITQVQNCLFAPSSITTTYTHEHNRMLVNHHAEAEITITNCYYNPVAATTDWTVQGMIAIDRALANGVIACKLQNGRTDMVWGQRVGIDLFPVFTNDESYRLYKCNTGGCTNDQSLAYTGLEQDAEGWYLLDSEWAWQDFAEVVGVNPTLSFNAKMTADINLFGDQTTIASETYPYKGTFDGQGHALTVDYIVADDGSSSISPFNTIQNATIQNLHVMGSITTAGVRPAGITSFVMGACYIRNCWSEVAITASRSGWIDGGGLAACITSGSTLQLDDCVFTGSITVNQNDGCSVGGFVGYTRSGGAVQAQNCLFAPSSIMPTSINTNSYDSYMFVNGIQDNVTITNCYYNQVSASTNWKVQGTPATAEQLADGTTATALQNGREEIVWVQNLLINQPMLIGFTPNTFFADGNWNDGSKWNTNHVPTAGAFVVIAAAATIPSGYTANAGTIAFTDNGSLTIAEGGQLLHDFDGLNVTMQKHITPYTGNQDHYYLIASPMANSLDVTDINMLLPEDYTTTVAVDLYKFDEGAEHEWINYEQLDGTHPFTTFDNTVGYLYANNFADGADLIFTGTLMRSDLPVEVPLNYTEGNRLAGWNLIGNPFACNAYLDCDFYRLGEDAVDLTPQSGAIAPNEGVFVHTNSTGNHAHFTREAPDPNNRGSLNVSVSNNGSCVDLARVRFGEGEGLEKFQLNPNHTKVYIQKDTKDYAVAYTESNTGELPVSFKAEKNGRYTLTFSNEEVSFSYLHLIDNMTGADIDLLQSPEYTFEAKTTDYAGRFKLMFNATAISENEEDNNNTFAYFNGDGWNISNTGEATLQVIDMLGRIVSSQIINGNAEINLNEASGVYVMRLVNGENVMTQKIVVR